MRQRLATYFDPLPFWHPSLEEKEETAGSYPLILLTQRPMTHYHSWGSHNAWLRQLLLENPLFINPQAAQALDLCDGQWVWMESRQGRMTATLRFSDAVEPGTVWTWNAIAKAPGAWGLHEDAPESQNAILVNHIVPDTLTSDDDTVTFNNDPVTGQAGWYDTKVRLYPSELHEVWPKVEARTPVRADMAEWKSLRYSTRKGAGH